jgi:hypothetical protein
MDLRLPIGGLFAIFGAILSIYGTVSNKAIYSKSLGINVNLEWGLVMLVFGALMLIFSYLGRDAYLLTETETEPTDNEF